MASIDKLTRKGRALILTYDHGLEHGPRVFDKHNVDPDYVLDLALEGGFSAIALSIGVAEKHYRGPYRDVPLIVKVNGATQLPHINPISAQICSVDRAIKAGASAIGFTIYDGSPNEPRMFEAFAKVCEQAHDYGLPVIAWMYPRGPGIRSMNSEVLAYSARIALELGADIVKIQYNDDEENLQWMNRVAGKTRIVLAGGRHRNAMEVLEEAKAAIDNGCLGMALGQNVWGFQKPYSLAKALRMIIYDRKPIAEAAMQLT